MKAILNNRVIFTCILVAMSGFCFASCNNSAESEKMTQSA